MDKERERMARFLGHWTARGTMEVFGTAAPVPWQGTSDFRRVLGGAFVRHDFRLEPGEAAPNGIDAVSFIGYEPKTARYTYLWLDSLGQVTSARGSWVDELAFVAMAIEPFAHTSRYTREVIRWHPAGQIELQRGMLIGTDKLRVKVRGVFTATDKPVADPVPTETDPERLGPQLASLAPLAGRWRTAEDATDEGNPLPARVDIGWLFGGLYLVLATELDDASDPSTHSELCFVYFDRDRGLRFYRIDSSGDGVAGFAQWLAPRKLILVSDQRAHRDAPFERTTYRLRDDGTLERRRTTLGATGPLHEAPALHLRGGG